MEDYFIDYLQGALDDRTRREVETYLEQNSEAREKFALLKQASETLAADVEPIAPPPQLVERTLARVAEHICAPALPRSELPHAPPVSRSSLPTGRSWWRRADVLVAVCLLVTTVGIGLMLLGKMRGPSSSALIADCKNNLRQYYMALQTYRDQRGNLPDIAKEEPRDVAGMVVPILNDAGVLPASVSIRCPGIGAPLTSHLTLTALRTMTASDFEQHSPCLSMCYAYSLGFRDASGAYHGPGDNPKSSWSQTPIMADRPPAKDLPNNSINHGGAGQNVLFADGHVKFLTERTHGGDDIFVNRAREVAAGVDATDIVLGYSSARPK